MACRPIVPFTIWDVAAGRDVANQGRGGLLKDSDGHLWEPVDLTPMQAALQGRQLGYLRDGKICDR
jgi:hypothetical protein